MCRCDFAWKNTICVDRVESKNWPAGLLLAQLNVCLFMELCTNMYLVIENQSLFSFVKVLDWKDF